MKKKKGSQTQGWHLIYALVGQVQLKPGKEPVVVRASRRNTRMILRAHRANQSWKEEWSAVTWSALNFSAVVASPPAVNF